MAPEIDFRLPATAPDFDRTLIAHDLDLSPTGVETLQINITKLCNQACHHCHVDSSPVRTEAMDRPTLERVLEVLAASPGIARFDITGGAPELHDDFDDVVRRARALGKHVMVRHNLTVQTDGHPITGASKAYLPEFFAEQQLEVISSLPYYQAYFTDKQRGRGVFEKSIDALQRLNAVGYGDPARPELPLNLIYNPVGAFLPAPQAGLEADFKRELHDQYGIRFNNLYAITNMPIHRFAEQLQRLGTYGDYMTKLANAFNPTAAAGVMCRSLISVSYDGRLYDCDFNQMLELPVERGAPQTIFDFDVEALVSRRIVTGSHCFGCTAGAGSSCGGETA